MNRAALHEKLQILRSVTNSHAVNSTSIIVDASKYISQLKQRVERLNEDIVITRPNSMEQDLSPEVQATVETLETGFRVKVISETSSCEGLLVLILEAFEDLSLNVMDAQVSCTHNFSLEAVTQQAEDRNIDFEVVQQAITGVISQWRNKNIIDLQD